MDQQRQPPSRRSHDGAGQLSRRYQAQKYLHFLSLEGPIPKSSRATLAISMDLFKPSSAPIDHQRCRILN
jgi:hypothetical protein